MNSTFTAKGRTYRVCSTKHYMLSRCLYCSFVCGKEAAQPPKFIKCHDGIYFKDVGPAGRYRAAAAAEDTLA